MDYDIAVIGGGPAGVSAAITAASKGRKVVLFEAHGFSPRLRSVAQITDYMGIPDISGTALMDIFVNHLKQMEVDIIEAKIISLREVGEGFMLGTPHGEYSADSVVLATGISRSTLFPGEKEFLGKGVSYCAVVDADKYKGKSVAAIATVPDALEEVEYLADQCEHVFFFPLYTGFVPPKKKNITVVLDKRQKLPVPTRLPACVQAMIFTALRLPLCSVPATRLTASCRAWKYAAAAFMLMIRRKQILKAFLPAVTAQVSLGR